MTGGTGDDPAATGTAGAGGGVAAVAAVIGTAGIAGRRLRTVVRLLTEAPSTLADLVRESTVERRAVEAVLAALGDDLETVGRDRLRVTASRIGVYRDLVGYPRLLATEPADPLGDLVDRHTGLVARMERLVADAPRPRRHLDHVSATARTAVRRAVWLDATFDLDGARLLCVGDHDLTSLAVAAVNPRAEVTVVDVDEEILGYVDDQRLPSVRCLWSDLRFGLAPGATGWGDLVFTDPPYTPEGVGLFLARGLEGLRDRDNARLVMAYGFGAGQPGLGLKVQQAVAGLRLVYEAVLPGFNRYHGAQAVGSASDLYVLRPTAGSWRPAGRGGVGIYTHGSRSLEASTAPQTGAAAALYAAAAAGGAVVTWVGEPAADAAVGAGAALPLDAVFGGGVPADLGRPGRAVAVDLGGDPGSWLVRVLLALDVQRAALLVPNNHPDLADEAAQRALTDLVGVKYRLRLRRSTPGPRYAIVEADRVDAAGLAAPARAARRVLDRAHGRVANTWREAVVRSRVPAPTKNEARALIEEIDPAVPDERLVDLPRHRIVELVEEIRRSVGG